MKQYKLCIQNENNNNNNNKNENKIKVKKEEEVYQEDGWRTVATSSSIPEVGFGNGTPLFTIKVLVPLRQRSLSISPPTSLPAFIMGRPPSSTPPPAADSVSTMSGASSTPSQVASPIWGFGKATSFFCCPRTPSCSRSFVCR